MWSHGTGAEVMQRIAVPMIGGMVSSTVLTLVVIPSIYAVVKGIGLPPAHWDGDGDRLEHGAPSRPLEVHEGAK
jgi:copper/silver efflux system protein